MKLSELLPESAVLLDLDGSDKWQIIETLSQALVRTEQIEGALFDEVHSALVARETSMSTGMEAGLAIPHASVARVEKTAVALGIAREGVDFAAIDGGTTHLVMLLVNPSNRTKSHIRTLAEIARLLGDADLRQALREAPGPAAALDLIREAESAGA